MAEQIQTNTTPVTVIEPSFPAQSIAQPLAVPQNNNFVANNQGLQSGVVIPRAQELGVQSGSLFEEKPLPVEQLTFMQRYGHVLKLTFGSFIFASLLLGMYFIGIRSNNSKDQSPELSVQQQPSITDNGSGGIAPGKKLEFNVSSLFEKDVAIDGTLRVKGIAVLSDELTVEKSVTLKGSLIVAGDTVIAGNFKAANLEVGTLQATNIKGDGADLDNLNASKITQGTLADARLSSNVALLNANQTFTGSNTFSQSTTLTAGLTGTTANLSGTLAVQGNTSLIALALTGGLTGTSADFTGTVSGADAVAANEFVTLGQVASTLSNAFMQGGNSFGATAVLGTNDNFALNFKTNNTTKVTLDTSGNLGIGTENPGFGLTVVKADISGESSIGIVAAGAAPVLQFSRSNGTAVARTQTLNGDAIFDIRGRGYSPTGIAGSPSVEIVGFATEDVTNIGNGGSLLFRTTTNGALSPVDRLIIANNGNVGIGTTTPSAKLEIGGSAPATGEYLKIQGTTNVSTGGFNSISNNPNITGGGNSGARGAYLGLAVSDTGAVNYGNPSLTASASELYVGLVYSGIVGTPTAWSGTVSQGTGASNAVINSSSATGTINTAYGTTTSVINTGATSIIQNAYGLDINSVSATGNDPGNAHNAYGLRIQNNITASGGATNNAYSLYNASTANSYFAGNVGIGTSSPTSKLDIVTNNLVGPDGWHTTAGTLQLTQGADQGTTFSGLQNYALDKPILVLRTPNGALDPASGINTALMIEAEPWSFSSNSGVAIELGPAARSSRIIHYGNNVSSTGSRIQLQTHSDTVGVWNPGLVMYENGVAVLGRAYNGSLAVPTEAQLQVVSTSPSRAALIAQGAASQTADLQQWQNSAGTVLTSVSSAGNITAPLIVTTGLNNFSRVSAANAVIGSSVTGDSFFRHVLLADGGQEWGSGTGARDTNLYRSAADTLKTDDAFIVGTLGSGGSTVLCSNAGQISTCGSGAGSGSYIFNQSSQQTNANFNILSVNASTIGAQVQGAASATVPVAVVKGGATPGAGGDLLQFQSSDGTVLTKITSTGNLTVKAASGQHITVLDPSNSTVFKIDNDGFSQFTKGLEIVGGTYGFALSVSPSSAGDLGVRVVGAASQTADLQQWQNSSGTVLSGVANDGSLYLQNGAYRNPIKRFELYGDTQFNVNRLMSYAPTGQVPSSFAYTVFGADAPYGTPTDVLSVSSTGAMVTRLLAATSVGYIVKGATSQAADLQQWQNSAGSAQGRMLANGSLILFDENVNFLQGRIANVNSGGTTFAQGYYTMYDNSTGTNIMASGHSGKSSLLVSNKTNDVNPGVAALVVQGGTSQTGDLQQLQNSSAATVAKFDSNGGLTVSANTNVLAAVAGNGTAATSGLVATGQKGGNTTGTTGQTAGAGATFTITSGSGGDAPSGSTNANGGNITLQTGAPGSGAGTAGSYGNIVLNASGGNVGIGTATPSQKLDVQGGNINTSGNLTAIGYGSFANGAIFGPETDTSAFVRISTNNAANKGLAIRGVALQTADLQQWQNSAGTVLAKVDAAGAITSGNLTIAGSGPNNIEGGVGGIGLNAWNNGTVFVGQSSSAAFVAYNSASVGKGLEVYTGAAGTVALKVQGASLQTADLQQWQDSVGTVHTKVQANGRLVHTEYATGVSNYGIDLGTVQNGSNGIVFHRDSLSGLGAFNIQYIDDAAGSEANTRLQIGGGGGGNIMTFKASGNVGIGTTSPTHKLEVDGTVGFVNSAIDSSVVAQMIYQPSSADRLLHFQNATSSPSGGFAFDNTSSGTVNLFTVQNGGNVGIGTTIPLGKLHIADTNKTLVSDLYNQYVMTTDTQAADLGGSIGLGGQYGSGNTVFGSIAGRKNNSTATDLGGYLQFATRATGSFNPTERLRIDSAGNVGIGTTSPSSLLSVNGDSYLNGHVGAGRGPSTGYGVILPSNTNNYSKIGFSDGATCDLNLGPDSTLVTTFVFGSSGCASNDKWLFRSAGTGNLMRLDASGALTLKGALTQNGAPDVSENVPVDDTSITAADVVTVGAKNPSPTNPYNTFFARKTSSAYESAIGVISTNPGILLNAGSNLFESGGINSNERPLAIAGRVPVKVTNEGGDIMAGDYLTASSKPGYAMKATHAGPTIGKALGDFSGTSGSVLTLVNISYYNPASGDNIQAKSVSTNTLQATGDVSIGGNTAMAGNLNVSGLTTLASLTVTGNTTIQGTLTVSNAIITSTLTVNGHIITGNTSGTTTATINANAGTGGTPACSVSGNDTGGQITLTTGTSAWVAGTQCTINFAGSFGVAPHPVLTPASSVDTTAVKPYVTSATGSFTVSFITADTAQRTYTFNYFNTQ